MAQEEQRHLFGWWPSPTPRRLILIVWVDDLFLFFPKAAAAEAEKLWKHLQANLDLDTWGDIDD